jgi:hypothetical protein
LKFEISDLRFGVAQDGLMQEERNPFLCGGEILL